MLYSLLLVAVGEPFFGAIGRCWLRMEWRTLELRLAEGMQFGRNLEFIFIFVFSSLTIDMDESSVFVDRNGGSFLSNVEVWVQSSLESIRKDSQFSEWRITWLVPDSVFNELRWLNNVGESRDTWEIILKKSKDDWKTKMKWLNLTWWLKAGLRLERFSGCVVDEMFFDGASLFVAVSIESKEFYS